jgi:hypothetical protein
MKNKLLQLTNKEVKQISVNHLPSDCGNLKKQIERHDEYEWSGFYVNKKAAEMIYDTPIDVPLVKKLAEYIYSNVNWDWHGAKPYAKIIRHLRRGKNSLKLENSNFNYA